MYYSGVIGFWVLVDMYVQPHNRLFAKKKFSWKFHDTNQYFLLYRKHNK